MRFASPEAFSFLLEYFGELRALQPDHAFKNKKERLQLIETKWLKFTKDVSWDTTSAKSLVKFLFPNWEENNSPQKDESPQGVQVSTPTDYWARFLTGESAETELRDQEVLRGIKNWKDNPDGKHFREMSIFEALSGDKGFVERFEHFSHFLSGQEIRNIASGLFALELTTKGTIANSKSSLGFIPLWRVAISKPLDDETKHLAWVKEEVTKALPISLQLANDIYYYWSSNSIEDVKMKRYPSELRAAIVAHAKNLFSQKPQTFIKALDPHTIHSSYQFSVVFSSNKENNIDFIPTDWVWFAELLVTAAEISPQVILPQIACMLVKTEPTFSGFSCDFRDTLFTGLFSNCSRRLMAALSHDISLSGLDDVGIKMLQVAKEKALQWIKENPPKKADSSN